MLVSKSKIRIWGGIFLILLFCFTNGLHEYLYGSENIAFITVVLGGLMVWSKSLNFVKKPMLYWVLLLLFIMLYNNQDNERYGTIFVFNTMIYVILWMLFCLFFEQANWHNAFIKIVISFGLFHAICTWIFYFTPSLYTGKIAPLFGQTINSLMSQYNHGWMPGLSPSYSTNAVYLGVALCVMLGVTISMRKKSFSCIIVVILLTTALLLTGKRSQILAVILSFLIIYYFYNSNKRTGRIFKIIAILVIGTCLFYIAAQFVPSLGNFVMRFEEGIASGDITQGRNVRFEQGLLLFLQHPLLGIGWNGTVYFFQSVEGLVINVHNIYIQLLAETGIIGFVTYFSFFLYNIYWGIKLLKYQRSRRVKTSDSVTQSLCCAVAIEVFFLFYGITGNPLYDYQTLFPYLGACAIVQYYKMEMARIY